MAGEIGHVPIDSAGPRCVCGQYGCLEAIAAGPAIAAYAAAAMPERRPSTAEVYALAAAGQPDAGRVVERAAGYLSRAVYLLLMTYDVEQVALGGGVTRAGAAFEQPLRRAMADLRANSPLTAAMMPDEKVVIIPSDYNAGVRGAIFLAPAPSPANRQGGR
jgi:glucokinase